MRRGTTESEAKILQIANDIAVDLEKDVQFINQSWKLNLDGFVLLLIIFFSIFLAIWSVVIYVCLHFSRYELDSSQALIQCRYYTILGIRDQTYLFAKIKSIDLIYHAGSKGDSGYYYLYLNHNKPDVLMLGDRKKRSDLVELHKTIYTFTFPDREYQEPVKPSGKLSDLFRLLMGKDKQ